MMAQYLALKEQAGDCLLFYRMGDFFELFFEDARVAAQVLDIALTSRGEHGGVPVPMCGVPHHAAEGYIARLIEAPRQAEAAIGRAQSAYLAWRKVPGFGRKREMLAGEIAAPPADERRAHTPWFSPPPARPPRVCRPTGRQPWPGTRSPAVPRVPRGCRRGRR